jgi:hypothetical protein
MTQIYISITNVFQLCYYPIFKRMVDYTWGTFVLLIIDISNTAGKTAKSIH